MTTCANCTEIDEANAGRHPWAVARLAAGYVWLHHCQYYPGAAFYTARTCHAELHELPPEERQQHLTEMALVAHTLHDEFNARKMNYEALGNSVPHLHWWLTPRPHDDPRPHGPIWQDPDYLSALDTGSADPDAGTAHQLRVRVLSALEAHGADIRSALVH